MSENRKQRRSAYRAARSNLSKGARTVLSLKTTGLNLFLYGTLATMVLVFLIIDSSGGDIDNFLIIALIVSACLAGVGLLILICVGIYLLANKKTREELDSIKGTQKTSRSSRGFFTSFTTSKIENRSQERMISSTQENLEQEADSEPYAISRGVLMPTVCPRCHRGCPSTASFCPSCGKPLKDEDNI